MGLKLIKERVEMINGEFDRQPDWRGDKSFVQSALIQSVGCNDQILHRSKDNLTPSYMDIDISFLYNVVNFVGKNLRERR